MVVENKTDNNDMIDVLAEAIAVKAIKTANSLARLYGFNYSERVKLSQRLAEGLIRDSLIALKSHAKPEANTVAASYKAAIEDIMESEVAIIL
ncbi:MAG: hypothetical protein JXM68_07020 [Sedimentisphaerales bacterium]|nr:hypothetical protein [Sedimentisphaerales bacterium]